MLLVAIILTLLLISFLLALHSFHSEMKKHQMIKEAEKELAKDKILFQSSSSEILDEA